MNKKGFTLIELLAVIVLLVIIISVVANSVNIAINNSRASISKTQKKALESAAQLYHIEKNIALGCISINDLYQNGYIEKEDIIDSKTNKELKGSIKIENRNGKYKYIYQEKSCLFLENGTPVYFDVSKGEICTEDIYKSSYDETINDYLNSDLGYNGITKTNEKQNSCLKFYAFNDDNKDTIDLILDHNTTINVVWNSNAGNEFGPKELIEKLNEDTKDWKGTIEPLPYIYDGKEKKCDLYYKTDYTGFNARIITLDDIKEIIGYYGNVFFKKPGIQFIYLDSLDELPKNTCDYGNVSGCSYGWLYDRITNLCTDYGCLNNSNSTENKNYSYYINAIRSEDNLAENANCSNTIGYFLVGNVIINYTISDVNNNLSDNGIRPVITISKSKF